MGKALARLCMNMSKPALILRPPWFNFLQNITCKKNIYSANPHTRTLIISVLHLLNSFFYIIWSITFFIQSPWVLNIIHYPSHPASYRLRSSEPPTQRDWPQLPFPPRCLPGFFLCLLFLSPVYFCSWGVPPFFPIVGSSSSSSAQRCDGALCPLRNWRWAGDV